MWCWVGLGLICSVGGLLGLVLKGPLSSTHEGTLECVVPINITECTWLVCVQRGIASWCIWSWGVLGWLVCHGIVGSVQLLTTSLWLVISLVVQSVISSFPLLIVGGRMVGTILLCKHLSQRSGWSEGRGLEQVVLAVHSRSVGVVVPQMWAFSPHTAVLDKPWPDPAMVAQVVHRNFLLRTGTSFLRSSKIGFGKQH